MHLIPALRKEAGTFCELKASLVYKSLFQDRLQKLQRNTVSINQRGGGNLKPNKQVKHRNNNLVWN